MFKVIVFSVFCFVSFVFGNLAFSKEVSSIQIVSQEKTIADLNKIEFKKFKRILKKIINKTYVMKDFGMMAQK